MSSSVFSIIQTAISTAYTLTRYFAMACASAFVLFGAVSVASVSLGYKITLPILLNVLFLALSIWAVLSPKLLLWPIAGYRTLRDSLDGFWYKLRHNYQELEVKHGYGDGYDAVEERNTGARWYQSQSRTHIHDRWAELDRAQ